MNQTPFSVSELYAPIVEELLASMNLTVTEVYRNGPRYWVGKVVRNREAAVLKVVIDDSPWVEPETREEFRPSDQLQVEILASVELKRYAREVSGNVPKALAFSFAPAPWMVRTFQMGQGMARGGSPLLFRSEFYTEAITESVIAYILSYQKLTPELQVKLPAGRHSAAASLAAKLKAIDLDSPSDLLAPFAAAIRDFVLPHTELHDRNRNTLSHGQVFPPHIYWHKNRIGLIDWENAGINNHLQDFVAIWIRSFSEPAWQDEYIERLVRHGVLATEEDRMLWRTEVLLQSGGNLNYLFWSTNESPSDQALAIAGMRRQIEEVLAKTL
ncbi:MAG TPA: phosphotransferase [Candidatus Saccharimonadia bacterium]|nr:phosphotransferase [Candidatus Saccharimonadia bacterium]